MGTPGGFGVCCGMFAYLRLGDLSSSAGSYWRGDTDLDFRLVGRGYSVEDHDTATVILIEPGLYI